MKQRSPGSYDFVLADAERLEGKLVALRDDGATRVLEGGTAIDGTGRRIENATVVLRGERIDALLAPDQPSLAVPPDATRYDIRGHTILPGLMDAHIHFMGNMSSDPYRSHFSPREEVKLIRAAFEFYETLASGVTTVRALGHGPAEHAYALRQAKLEGIIEGPRMLTSGWALSQTRGHGDVPELPYEWVEHDRPRATFCDGPLECRVAARRNFGEGADVIKVYSSDNRTGRPDFTVEELAAVVDEAHRRGRKVATHAKTYEGVRNALLAGIDTIEHGTAEVHRDLIDLMLERNTVVVPTLATIYRVAIEGADWGLESRTMERAKRELEGRQRSVRAAAESGVRIATGSDAGARAGFGLLSTREIELLVDCGLSPLRAITASTATASEAIGLAADVGTIAIGKLADLIVVAGDPLADITVLQDRTKLRWIFQARDPLIY